MRPGKATPKLRPPRLRRLPSSWVTDEVQEPKKIHELDDPHIVGALAQDIDNAEKGVETLVQQHDRAKEESKAPEATLDPRQHKLNQLRVDCVRLRVLGAVVRRLKERAQSGLSLDWAVQHIWFPRDDDRIYELRRGNPPPDVDRPKHLKRIQLEIDASAGQLPESIARLFPGIVAQTMSRAAHNLERERQRGGVVLL